MRVIHCFFNIQQNQKIRVFIHNSEKLYIPALFGIRELERAIDVKGVILVKSIDDWTFVMRIKTAGKTSLFKGKTIRINMPPSVISRLGIALKNFHSLSLFLLFNIIIILQKCHAQRCTHSIVLTHYTVIFYKNRSFLDRAWFLTFFGMIIEIMVK